MCGSRFFLKSCRDCANFPASSRVNVRSKVRCGNTASRVAMIESVFMTICREVSSCLRVFFIPWRMYPSGVSFRFRSMVRFDSSPFVFVGEVIVFSVVGCSAGGWLGLLRPSGLLVDGEG